jgi:exopolyphosphatase/guanosine-5'-triphosphate,3'-diphosphate pyrophosphatase
MGAIDIGSSAIRMDIAEVRPDGSLRLLDSLKKGVQLGRDVFSDGHLSEETVRAACTVLRDFKSVMDSYGVARYRAVATSAVRESTNSDTFLDRVLMSTGLDVDVIDGSEENRLTLSGVLESLRGRPELDDGKALLVEIGGGSSDVTLLSGGEPLQSGNFPLGSIRLRAGLTQSGTHEQHIRLLKRQITNILTNIKRSIPMKETIHYIAVGGDVRFAARALKMEARDGGATIIPRDAFAEFVESISRLPADALVEKYAMSYLDAETVAPALLAYLQLLKETQAQSVIVSTASIRAGILHDFAPSEGGKRLKRLTHQILTAARSLGRKYQYDETHADRVCQLSELIFDEVRAEHGLNDTHRLYLQVAALLHDIGLFVSPRNHHKHSYYLIAGSDLFGLRRLELEIIANVARYHRRSMPQRSHANFVSLDRDERVVVSKLSAILRVANALDKEHLQKVTDLKISREGDQLVLLAQNVTDLSMERIALADRSELFTDVFGKKIVLREAAKIA